MKRFVAVFLIGALALLSACGGGDTTPVTPPPAPLVTPIGANVGAAVTQTIGASGGTVTAGGINLEVLPATLGNATVTLQPIADTLNGSGQGIAISSDSAWSKYAKISFPISASDDNPEGLGLAVQQADGSWRALEPVKVDVVAGTVSAGLPAVTEAGMARVRAQGGLDLTRVIKFKRFYLKPASATLKVKGTKTFVPYARVLERPKGCTLPPVNPDDELIPLPPKCWVGVTLEYPFTNDKDGFARSWSVNGVLGGNSTVGTISKSGLSGATYTAPDMKPSPDTVSVSFQSVQIDTLDSVTRKASVKIIGDVIGSYTGSVAFNVSDGSITHAGQGSLTWKLIENSTGSYEATGSMKFTTTRPNCSTVSTTLAVRGRLSVENATSGGTGNPFAGKYWFTLGPDTNLVNMQCGQPPQSTPIPYAEAQTACPLEDSTLANASKYSDPSRLTNSGSWTCFGSVTTIANWDFVGN